MYRSESPHLIQKDNPHAKFLFALRDPVARAWSDYRFNYKGERTIHPPTHPPTHECLALLQR